MVKFFAKRCIFICAFFVFTQVSANSAATLYDFEVSLVDEYTETRETAFKQGLAEIFVRISGDSTVMDKIKVPVVSRFIKQFSYGPVLNESEKTLKHRLKVQYNDRLIEKYLRSNGVPTWDKYRQDIVPWIVVRDGVNENVLNDADFSLIKTAVDDALTQRGVPRSWPLGDIVDQRMLTGSDIRGGFETPILTATKRYSKGAALTGSVSWSGEQWQSNWNLFVEGEVQHWNFDDVEYSALVKMAIDKVSDTLGDLYAVSEEAGDYRFAALQLDIQDVDTIERYRFIENYLTDLNIVESTTLLTIENRNVVFEVILKSSQDDFLSVIRNDGMLGELVPQSSASDLVQGKRIDIFTNTGASTLSLREKEKAIQQILTPVYHYKLKR